MSLPGPPTAVPAEIPRRAGEAPQCGALAVQRVRSAAEACAYAPIRNTGWSGAIRRSSSSDESALTPPKNTPISQLQRFR